MKRFAVLLLASAAAFAASAQDPKVVGKLTEVQGLVTVSTGDQLINASEGTPALEGSRIITTAGGEVTIVFDRGCRIRLRTNQSLTVRDSNDCAAILASVQNLGGVPPVVTGAAGSPSGAAVFGGAAAVLLLVSNNNSSSQVSPN
ncbi:hypothetical protein [Tibeticola sp.]|uniref:hypothetical protein n=1 Tax=Tibeticola sp. TaxID=2005368 RepID=UPI0025CD9E9C|nr:hypothetical protein [Tibeticola sp.]